MSMSIEELDATVRAFYEGRGETVCFLRLHKTKRLSANCVRFATAKTSPGYIEPGMPHLLNLSRRRPAKP